MDSLSTLGRFTASYKLVILIIFAIILCIVAGFLISDKHNDKENGIVLNSNCLPINSKNCSTEVSYDVHGEHYQKNIQTNTKYSINEHIDIAYDKSNPNDSILGSSLSYRSTGLLIVFFRRPNSSWPWILELQIDHV